MIHPAILPIPCALETNRLLGPLTTWRVGGPADFYAEPRTPGELAFCYEFCRTRNLPLLALGGASNVLVHDQGFRGLAVRYLDDEEQELAAGANLRIRVGARALLARLARRLGRRGWAGLEWAEGIPGTLGGAIVGNAGAFGGEIAGVISYVEIYAPHRGEIARLSREGCAFSYRSSHFKAVGTESAFVLGAELEFSPLEASEVLARMDYFRSIRKSKSPTGLTCGSVFQNPPGDFAGRIVEALGLKGTSRGGAEISAQHGNYIVNRGGATAADILALIELVQQRARRDLGIDLHPEVRFIGFPDRV